MFKPSRLPVYVSILILLLLGALAPQCRRAGNDLNQRVEEYYGAIVSRDFGSAYDLEQQLVRDEVSRDQYIETARSNSAVLDSFIILSTITENRQAKVHMRLSLVIEGQNNKSEFYDVWVLEKSSWFHAPN
jgi:hypothetical protein